MESYAQMSNEQLIAEFESEAIASERCASTKEITESAAALKALREEMLKRMTPSQGGG